MSKLNDLIEKLCPDGVEYVKTEEILTIKNGSDYKSFQREMSLFMVRAEL